jgi:putative MFS transporter
LLGLIFFFEFGDINTFSFAAPVIAKQWGLTINQIGRIVSSTFIGMFLGATLGGWFADRVGRKPGLILTTFWYSIFSILNAFVGGMDGLFIARLLTGVGLSAMTVTAITYISEMFPASKRGRFQSWIMTIGIAGITVTAFVAEICIPRWSWGWRLVFVWGGGAVLLPFLGRLLEESPIWLERNGRLREAEAVLQRIESTVLQEGKELKPPDGAPAMAPASDRRYGDLFRGQNLSRTAMLVVVWIAQTLGFYGFVSWVPTLLVKQGLTVAQSLHFTTAMHTGAVPGVLLSAFVAERWERKWSIVATAVLTAVSALCFGFAVHGPETIAFGFAVAMLIQCFSPLIYAYTAECFPTDLRSSGSGLTYGIGRLANSMGPLLIALLFTRYGYRCVFVYISACWFIAAAVIGLFGPRTRGRLLA